MKPQRLVLKFCTETDGTVAIIFAMIVIPLCLGVGLAVDGGRAYSTNSKVMAVLDAAALSAAKSLQNTDLDDDAVIAIAKRWVAVHMDREVARHIHTTSVDVEIDRNSKTVTTKLQGRVKNYIGPIIGVNHFDVKQSASANFDIRPVELGLMLDVSGSMQDRGKIEDLKSAVNNMLDVLIADGKPNDTVKVGVAPFASAINAGEYAIRAHGGKGGNCVNERKGAKAFTDDSPYGNPLGGLPRNCPQNAVFPISNNKKHLKRNIDDLHPGGATAGHLGIAWAWYLISPNWADFWPHASRPKRYGEDGVVKSLVLMTDGEFNIAYEEKVNGDSETQALKLCNNIKAEGIKVYTVGFDAPPKALALLKRCASDDSHFFDAANRAELTKAFAVIAHNLTALRLSR